MPDSKNLYVARVCKVISWPGWSSQISGGDICMYEIIIYLSCACGAGMYVTYCYNLQKRSKK
jgi:hypothetical protein